MVIKVKANPTFIWEITIDTPEGEIKPKFEYKHMTTEQYDAYWATAREQEAAHAAAAEAAKAAGEPEPQRKRTALDDVMDIVVGWQDFDEPFSRSAMDEFMKNYHLATLPIFAGWVEGLRKGKQKN